MKGLSPHPGTTSLVLILAALTLSSCSPPWVAEEKGNYSDGLITRLHGPPPESYWNRLGVWQRVADDPPTYIPTGYSVDAPRTDETGTWIVDKRDGKRLFVPNPGAGGYSRQMLYSEARDVTTWADNRSTERPLR